MPGLGGLTGESTEGNYRVLYKVPRSKPRRTWTCPGRPTLLETQNQTKALEKGKTTDYFIKIKCRWSQEDDSSVFYTAAVGVYSRHAIDFTFQISQ